MASIKRELAVLRQAEALRIAIAESSSSASVPPPPPEPLPPPATEPEEKDDEFEADFDAEAEASSAYSEYENDVGNFDDDLSTAPSEAMATRRTARTLLHGAPRFVLNAGVAHVGVAQCTSSRELHEAALRRQAASIST